MALFKKKPVADDGPPDETLTFMGAASAGRIRALLASAFAEQGLEMQVFNDHLVDADGRQFGLYNVGAACFNDERGESAWPEIVRDHVTRILASMDAPSPFETMTDDELRASVFPRLYERSGMPPQRLPAYAQDFSDDVVEVLNIDLPDTVLLLNQEELDRLGGRAAVRPTAMRNLMGVLPGLEVEVLSNGEAALHVAMSDSMFTASTVLAMPELLARLGIGDTDNGVLVAMPFRFQVAVHAIRDASVIPSLNAMVGFAINGFNEGVGPLTPHVFWWHQGFFEQITKISPDGGAVVEVGAELQAVLERLTS